MYAYNNTRTSCTDTCLCYCIVQAFTFTNMRTFTITAHKVLDTIPQKAIDYVREVLLDQPQHYEHDITYRFLWGGEYTTDEFAILLSHTYDFYGKTDCPTGIDCTLMWLHDYEGSGKMYLVEEARDEEGELFDFWNRRCFENPNTIVLCGVENHKWITYFVTDKLCDVQRWVQKHKSYFVEFQPSIAQSGICDYEAFVAAVNALPAQGYIYRVGSGKYSDIYDMYTHFKMEEPTWRK